MGNDESHALREIALLVRHVPSAISSVVSVRPDQTLAEAQTLMSANEYSQLAVFSDDGRFVGAVSWRSIAQARLSKDEITLRDARVRSRTVHMDDDLRDATGQKKLESAADMTFGQYEYLLKNADHWRRMGWTGIEQATFIKYLDDTRIVRNKVMHSGEELEPCEKRKLERFFNLMRALDPQP